MTEAPTVPAISRAVEDNHPLFFGERWRALALLGTGGMGSVYLARDAELGELVALKMVRPSLTPDPEMIERFRDEVRLSRRVSSPYVARTHDLGMYDGRLFLTMQYVDGETLSARLKREGALPLAEVVRIARDLCAGLDAIHQAGVVHRDLKPGNVLLAKDGRAVITDFGIALRADHGRDGTVAGTPSYSAPEQLLGEEVTARADVYALGALLFATATGRRPFEGARTGNEQPPNVRKIVPSLSDAFAGVVATAMAVDSQKRYASAGALYDALAPLAGSGERVEDRLFDFVRSIVTVHRRIAIDLACEGLAPPIRDAILQHLASRLSESGEVEIVRDSTAAEAVVEGTLSGRTVGMTFQLRLRSRDGDVFCRQEVAGPLPGVVESAALALSKALATHTRAPDERLALKSPEAAELFLRARAAYRNLAEDNTKECIALLERIEAIEPNNPTVLGWKALAVARMRFFVEGPDEARDLVQRALALGSTEATPHIALAQSHLQAMQATLAARHFTAGLRRAPGTTDTLVGYARFLCELGALEPASHLVVKLQSVSPTYVAGIDVLLRAAAVRRRVDELKAIHAGIAQNATGRTYADFAMMHYALWFRDREAFELCNARVLAAPIDATGHFVAHVVGSALAEGVLLDQPSFEALLATLTPRRRAIGLQYGCEVGALLNDDTLFFRSLESLVACGFFDTSWLDGCPLFDRYRGRPRFELARATVHRRAYEALAEIDRCLGDPL